MGFGLGVLWPRLAGVKLVPSAPVAEEQAAAEAPAASASAPVQLAAPPPVAKTVAVAPLPPKVDGAERLRLSEPHVTSCRDASGKRIRDCDPIRVDAWARPRILSLGACPAAAEARGALSLGLELDFDAKKLKTIAKGKSTTLEDGKASALLECARSAFANAPLDGIEHAASLYTVFYRVEFLPPGAPAPAASGENLPDTTAASGRATVTFEVALLRSSPNKDGEIVARVLRGTHVTVSGKHADWYKVKYDAKGNEAWVHRSAIGL